MGNARRTPAGGDLRIAPDLTLPADYVAGGSLAILGKRGAGKTFTSRVLAEELFEAKVHLVILDPMGVYWGLRAASDGTAGGLPIPIFGGRHADAPLEPDAGTLMADLVVEERLSMILDMSGFQSRTQERNFAAGFFDRLYRRNQDLVHVIVDEADMFAPQRPRGQDAPLLATMENLVRRGRNRAIGVTMTSQRHVDCRLKPRPGQAAARSPERFWPQPASAIRVEGRLPANRAALQRSGSRLRRRRRPNAENCPVCST